MKIIYRNIGGIMIWAIDQDTDDDILLNLISSANLCKFGLSGDDVKHKCLPIDEIRWWTFENGGETKQGMCGKSAPLINGFYPVCDPDDPGFVYLMDAPDGKRGRCGPTVPLLNGKHAICNPDDNSAHCCSNGYYCGTGDAFCECNGCIDFKKNPNYQW
uniref:Chitin-binding type-1 domain-containing protein n=1 Tax=Panagrolaimus davidi TaxID=227884 RepID=A0A914PSM6_9BILA